MKPVRNADILRLAGPLLATNAIQALLNLTDVWFLGRLSTEAVAAISAIYWIVSCVTMLLAGVSLIVQSFVSQAVGARRFRAASASAWSGIWAALAILPVVWLLAWGGPWLIGFLDLAPKVAHLANEYWQPRMLGLPLGMCAWALMSFFNGSGMTRKTLLIVGTAVLVNIPLNQWLIFEFGLGMRGAAWATNIAQAAALLVGLALFLSRTQRQRYAPHLTFRARPARVWRMWRTGMPVGVMYGADLIGVALFQLMVAQSSIPGAAATQIVMTLTSLAYQPTMGIASAGSILVGQAIGSRDIDYARRIGDRSILLCVGCMVVVALCLVGASRWLIPLFLGSQDLGAQQALPLALQIVWIAAAYQAFDGLYFGAGFALRAAGDTRVPALTALLLSWLFFVPLAQCLVFTENQAWVSGLPQVGLGAIGGWVALCSYAMLLGVSMLWRWRLGSWRNMRLS